MRMRSLIVVFAVVAASGRVGAQVASQGGGGLVPIPYRSYVGINPLGIPFDIFAAEVESGVAQGVTLGAVGSYIDVDDHRYTSFDFKFRYYPGEVVLRGFSLGAFVGYLHYESNNGSIQLPNGQVERQPALSTPTIGVIADYNWMLGTQRRFLVGTGVGAKRVLANSEERQRAGIDRAILTARFTVGLAF